MAPALGARVGREIGTVAEALKGPVSGTLVLSTTCAYFPSFSSQRRADSLLPRTPEFQPPWCPIYYFTRHSLSTKHHWGTSYCDVALLKLPDLVFNVLCWSHPSRMLREHDIRSRTRDWLGFCYCLILQDIRPTCTCVSTHIDTHTQLFIKLLEYIVHGHLPKNSPFSGFLLFNLCQYTVPVWCVPCMSSMEWGKRCAKT